MSKERVGSKERLGSKQLVSKERRMGESEPQRLPRDRSGKLITPPTTSPSAHLFFRWSTPSAEPASPRSDKTLQRLGSFGSQEELQDEENPDLLAHPLPFLLKFLHCLCIVLS